MKEPQTPQNGRFGHDPAPEDEGDVPMPGGNGEPTEELPFPTSDMPPALQRTLARKMREERENGCADDAPTEGEFMEALRRVARPQRSG